MRKINIAIDGPAGAGKSTIAKALANLTRKIAVSANGAASTMGTYQPKEPKMLKNEK